MMMKNGLEKGIIIEADKLDRKWYFQSLIEQALVKGLLSAADIERLQYECLDLLSEKIKRYNSGDSSSIRVEKAQNMMSSNLFTIGIWLKTFSNPDDAAAELQKQPVKEVWQKGLRCIDTMLTDAKAVHAALVNQLLDSPNIFYSSTIKDGIEGFFKLYNPEFEAQEIHITADYPVYNPLPELLGIEFIQAYLNALYNENLFLTYFNSDNIHHLLCGRVEDYQEHLINLYEPVLLAALGCTITGTSPYSLEISGDGMDYLYRVLNETPQNKLTILIQNSAGELMDLLDCPKSLRRYIQSSLPLIVKGIHTAVKEQTISRLFVSPDYPENRSRILFSYGNKMDNEMYRRLIEEINQCIGASDKAAMIKERIKSFADLEDVVLDADLTREDMNAVLSELSLTEIAVFSKRYMPMNDGMPFQLREQELHFRKYLHDFIIKLPKQEQERVEQIIRLISYS